MRNFRAGIALFILLLLGTSGLHAAQSLSLMDENAKLRQYVSNQQFELGIRHAKKLLRKAKRYYPDGHLHLGYTNGYLAFLYFQKGQYEEAIAAQRKSIETIEKFSGGSATQKGEAMMQLARYQIGAKDITGAIETQRESIQIFANAFGVTHPRHPSFLALLCSSYILLGDLVQAEKVLTEALNLMAVRYNITTSYYPDLLDALWSGFPSYTASSVIESIPGVVVPAIAQTMSPFHTLIYDTFLRTGLLLEERKKTDAAIKIYNQAKQWWIQHSTSKMPNSAYRCMERLEALSLSR